MENSVPVLKIQYYRFIPSSTCLQRSSDRRQRTSASVRQTVVNASRHKLPVNSRFTCWRPSYYLISPTSVIRCQRVMSLRSVLSHFYYSSDIRHSSFGVIMIFSSAFICPWSLCLMLGLMSLRYSSLFPFTFRSIICQ